MKKLLLFAILFAFSIGFAQNGFVESDNFLEGTFEYKDTQTVDSQGANLTLGHFFTNKLALGVNVGVGRNVSADGEYNSSNGDNFNVGLLGRYYFLNVGQNFKVHTQLGFGTVKEGNSEAYFNSGLGLGVNYFVTKNLALVADLANLASYSDNDEGFTVGFTGVTNPLNAPKFGLLYRF